MKKYYGADTVRNKNVIIAGFDTETEGLGGRLLSIQYGIFGRIEYDCSENKVDNFLDFIMQYPEPVIWFCHFAQYDWRYFMDRIIERKIKVFFSMRDETNVYQIVLKREDGKKVIMRDSFALWNGTLEALANSFCPEIPKLKIDIVNFDPSNEEHIKYAKRDVEILLTALPRLFAMLYKHFGIFPNATTASTALKAWQFSLAPKVFYNTSKYDEREKYIRQSYYGGLVFLTTTQSKENCITFDVNSSYPSVMRDYGVPYGACVESKDYQTEKMGIYRVRVKTPDDLVIPILPARDKRGMMRWFRGTFETVVTNSELIFAVNHGYKVLKLCEGLVWEKRIKPFDDFIEHCQELRKRYKKKPEEILAKLMQNSLYGKFGSRRERMHLYASSSCKEEDFIGAEKYDDDGLYFVKREFEENLQCIPQWAVFITAHARLKLLQAAYGIGVEHVFYGDTDSLTVDSGYKGWIDVGDDYGQWKIEKRWKVFRAIAPKVYSGILEDGRRYAAAKGIPRKALNDSGRESLLLDGKLSVSAESISSLRVSLREGVQSGKTLTRKSTDIRNSINFELLQNGIVRPKMAA